MAIIFSFVGFIACVAAGVFAVVGIIMGIIEGYDYFVDLKRTVSRIETTVNSIYHNTLNTKAHTDEEEETDE